MSVLLVDDHEMIAEPLKMALASHGFSQVHAVGTEDLSVDAVLRTAREVGAEIVLLDLYLGGDRLGVPMIAPLMAMGAKVVLFTASKDPLLIASGLRAGAEAVIDKAMAFHRLVAVLVELAAGRQLMPPEEREALVEALQEQASAGHEGWESFDRLTEREAHVLRSLIGGHSPKGIARRDGISLSTVRGHIERIFDKLEVSSQREALARARAAGWPADAESVHPAQAVRPGSFYP